MEIKKQSYVKINNKWGLIYEISGPDAAEDLAQALSAKYLEKAPYIKSVRRQQHYSHKTITILFDNGVKQVFTVPAQF